MQKAGTGLIVAGWIFAILGGLIGLIIGAHIAFAKVPDANGQKVPKYDDGSRTQGKIMFAIACVVFALGMIARNI